MSAPLGDDVLGDDPTVQALETHVSMMLGKEAACFVPSGTMANQTAIRAHTEPGDEIIAHEGSHIYQYEGGAPAALAGCTFGFLRSDDGRFEADAIAGAVRPDDTHFPRTRLLVIENTHNRGGGTIWPLEQVLQVTTRARELGLRCHLDGARLMNACVATGLRPLEYASCVDTVSMCFSKGLGAPVGSIVAGDAATVARIRRFRKMFGGAMRQSGLLAAAAMYALQHHVDRLSEDHAHARRLAEVLSSCPGVTVDMSRVQTNIVYFEVDASHGTAAEVCARLASEGVWMLAVGPRVIRAVTHLDVDASGVDRACEVLSTVLGAA